MPTISALLGNAMRLDGGAMFGNVPKALWQRWLPADAENRINLACRCLLVQDGQKLILFETGIGTFFPPHLKDRYGVVEDQHQLLQSLAILNISPSDIDVVVLSHLHFDHAGGLLTAWSSDQPLQLLFTKARYLVSKPAWERACRPHYRDRASFIPELNALLQESGRLVLIDQEKSNLLGNNFHFRYSNGHTPGMMHSVIETQHYPIIFAADLIPGVPWVHLPVTMGYDRAPEQLIDEKQQMLEYALTTGARLFYTHDPETSLSAIAKDEQGRFIAIEKQTQLSRQEL